MSLSPDIQEKISHIVIDTLVGRFMNFPEDASGIRNAPFHKAFLNAFREKLSLQQTNADSLISLSSWLQGLNTTLGQLFFEKVAQEISGGAKRKFNGQKISTRQKTSIAEIITDLKNGTKTPCVSRELEMITNTSGVRDTDAVNFTADVFYEEDDRVVAIELKSVKPNSGEMKGEKMKILEGKAVLKYLYPNKDAYYYIGFPFDPTVDTSVSDECSFDKPRFFSNIVDGSKFFDPDETLIASEFWDFLSRETGTMPEIITIINSIATTEFMSKFDKIQFPSSCTEEEYVSLLDDWYLYSDKNLYLNDQRIREGIMGNRTLTRLYNSPCFNADGKYNYRRFEALNTLL